MSKLEFCELGDLIEFQRGYDLPKSNFVSGPYPVQSSNGILGYHNEFKVKGPSITIGRSGTVGIPHLIEGNFFPHNTALFIKDFKGNDVRYIYYLLKNLRLGDRKSGSGVPTMNRNHLHPLKMKCFRDVDYQNKLSCVLNAIDKKIEINNKINTELEAMTKLIYEYWFVQFNFPDANGKPYKSSGGKMVYNEVLKREIPDGWREAKLEDIITRSATGLNPRNNFSLGEGENYYITIKSIKNGRIVFDDRCDRVSDESLEIIDKRSNLQVGDVLFTSIQPVGVTYLIQEKPANWNINESVFTIRADSERVTSEFLYMMLSSSEIKAFTKQSSTGSIHKGIRHGVLKAFNLPYGGKGITKSFSEVVSPMLLKSFLLDNENQQLQRLQDWILPMLMNGQVKIE